MGKESRKRDRSGERETTGKITGLENAAQVPPKVRQMYRAVIELIEEGTDVGGIRVSTITERAGIGKGTAYEYFDSKEELVACAVVYQLQCVFGWLEREMEKRESLGEQMNFLLNEMGKKDGRRHGFLRFVHMLTDNSGFSGLVREKMEAKEFAPYLPMNVFGKVLKRGVERGELRNDLPLEYLIYCVFSHLLTYMMAITTEDCFCVKPEVMRPLVYQGIMNELGQDRNQIGNAPAADGKLLTPSQK